MSPQSKTQAYFPAEGAGWAGQPPAPALRAALDLSGTAVLVADAAGQRILAANGAAHQLFGYAAGTLCDLDAERLLPLAEAREGAVAEILCARADGTTFAAEVRRCTVDDPATIYLSVLPATAVDPALVQERLERYRAAIDESGDGIVMIDAETLRYLEVNQRMAEMLQASREEVLATGVEDWLDGAAEENIHSLRTSFRFYIEQFHTSHIVESALRRRDGTVLPVESSRRAILQGDRWMIVASLRDISARQRAQAELDRRLAELARSNENLEKFAYIASHDLSEPLRTVSSYAQLLKRRYANKLDQDADEFIEFMTSGTARMKQLIDDLLAYAHAGRPRNEPGPVDLNKTMREVERNLQDLVKEKGATLTFGGLPVLTADATSMVQLLQNLVANALKFTAPQRPPVVRVQAVEAPGEWILSVSDNGIGIEPQHFQRIFDVFQRLHTRDAYSGTGIGLSICKRIIEAAGGRIWLESRFGEGTTFFFALPRR